MKRLVIFFPVILLKLIWEIKDLKIDYNIWDVLKRIYGNMNWDLKKKKLWPVVKFYILVISNFFFTLTNYFKKLGGGGVMLMGFWLMVAWMFSARFTWGGPFGQTLAALLFDVCDFYVVHMLQRLSNGKSFS